MLIEPVTIRARGLTKHFGTVAAVTDLSFDVEPGVVTGFLGPNGSGKTTTMRMILDLVTPTSGTATIGGRRYADLPRPTDTVGAVLDSAGFHPGRTAKSHLRIHATMAGYARQRVDELMEQLDITGFKDRKIAGFSTGMRQRLNLATALLGDPKVLLLDEPSNGLDPQGIAWLRDFLRRLAAQGRTILVSSHVLAEMEQTADQVIVIRQGELITAGPISRLSEQVRPAVVVHSPDAARLPAALREARNGDMPRARVESIAESTVRIEGASAAEIADIAVAQGIRIHELTPERANLEQAFLRLTTNDMGSRR